MMKLPAVLIGFLVIVSSVPAEAQVREVARLTEGMRLRVTDDGGRRWVGKVAFSSPDSLLLELDGSGSGVEPIQAFSPASLQTIEMSAGWERKMGRAIAISSVIGAGLGTAIAAAAWSPCDVPNCITIPDSRGEAMVLGAVYGAAALVPAGIVISHFRRHEVWRPIRVRSGARLDIELSRGGALSVGISFPTRW